MRYFDCLVVFIYVLHLKVHVREKNTLVDCLELSIDVVVGLILIISIYITMIADGSLFGSTSLSMVDLKDGIVLYFLWS